MPQAGWIILSRKMQSHWLWEEKPFSRGQAWIDLIFLMNHEDREILFNGQRMTVERGSHVTSIRKLAERWGWSKDKVVHFLNTLEAHEMLHKKHYTSRTVLTLVNYDFYQAVPATKKTESGQKKDSDRTPTGRNNKLNKYNKLNNIPPISPTGDCARRFEIFWAAYPRKVTRARAEKAFAEIDPDEATLSRMLKALERQSRLPNWQEEGGRYIPYPGNWLKERRWEEEPQAAPKPVRPYAGYRRLTPDD